VLLKVRLPFSPTISTFEPAHALLLCYYAREAAQNAKTNVRYRRQQPMFAERDSRAGIVAAILPASRRFWQKSRPAHAFTVARQRQRQRR